SLKTVSEHLDNESPAEKTPAPSIAKRLGSNSGKDVVTAGETTKTPKKWKKVSKAVQYGPKKQWSKVATPVESKKKSLKRKEISSSDS
ncbi:hypothetical protein A2U01_0082806, partial [Trifolium medium]|nr:hypothetical protein [Trifolium medium]